MATAYHFWKVNCAPCELIKPSIADIKEEFPNVNWVSVNIENDSNNYAEKYFVTKAPTIVVVSKHGIESHSGTQMMGYYRMLINATKV